MISIVQNFICTKFERLEVIERNLPLLGNVFKDFQFFVNYNSKINLDRIYTSYSKYIPNLNFYNDLSEEWAPTILSLSNEAKTPYIMHLCEDMIVNSNYEKIHNCIGEYIKNDFDYFLLTKVEKYLDEKFITGNYTHHFTNKPGVPYKKLNHGYFYLGKDAPQNRLSTDAIYKSNWYKERIEEFILNVDKCINNMNIKNKKTPNCYEEYYSWSNGIVSRFGELKCYIPDEVIILEFNDTKEDIMWENIISNEKK